MLTYWVLLLLPAYLALVRPKEKWNNQTSLILIFLLTIIIGFRFQIGDDWGNYINKFENLKKVDNVFLDKEFLYSFLNVISRQLNFGIYGVNLISGFIFSYGLILFCKSMKRQWLALTLSIPYIVIVIAMGYTRQSVALGILMIGYVVLSQGKKLMFFILNICASFFHLSSIIGIFLLAPFFISSRKYINKISKTIISFLIVGGLYFVLIDKFIARYIDIYIETEMSSSGVFIRLFMILFPSILFLLFEKNLQINANQKILYRSISYYSLSLIPLLIIIPSTTVVDRLSLYALPIMTFTMSNLPELKFANLNRKYINLLAVLMAFLIQYVWLNFAGNSSSWKPYQNILL